MKILKVKLETLFMQPDITGKNNDIHTMEFVIASLNP
jgi:hypothetical protein